MLKKTCVWFGALSLAFLMMFASCKHDGKGGGNKPPAPVPEHKDPIDLISKVRVESGNGIVEVLYEGAEINVKGQVALQVILQKGIMADDAKISATFGGESVSFSDFQEQYFGAAALLQNLQGVTVEAKEMVIEVKVGENVNKRCFKIKMLDEATLPELKLESFKIGNEEVTDRITEGPTWRIYDPSSNKIKLTATMSRNLKEAVIIINGKTKTLSLDDANKKEVVAEVEFEKNSIKNIAFVFKAEGAKDFAINPFTLIFTNTVAPIVTIEAARWPDQVSDEQLILGKLAYPKCMTQEPKIIVKSFISYGNKITKVSVDGVDVEIKADNPNVPTATYTLNPPLEKAGDTKTVKVRVEGVFINDKGEEIEKEPLEFDVTFTLVQFIEATLQIKEGAGAWQDLQGEKRVYDQNVKIKLVAREDDFTDVRFKNYIDADGNTPDFDIAGKEATASIKLKDTKLVPSTIKIIAEANDRTPTEFVAMIRYSVDDDPLGVFTYRFDYGDIEKQNDPDGTVKMTRLRATVRVLVSQNCDEITSIKINDAEVLNKSPYSDPEKIVESAKSTATSGPGGKSVNAVIVIGNDNMKKDHVYTLNISLAGKTADGHNLTHTKLPPLKIKLPDHGDSNTDWLSPYGSNAMDLTIVSADYHKDDQAKTYWNYYGVQRITAAVNPKNPEATVEGFWYKHDTGNTEWTKIINAGKDDPEWKNRYFTFKEVDTITGHSKWGFDLDLTTADKEGLGISIYLYVVAKDGTTNKKTWPEFDLVNFPYQQNFRKLDLSASYTKLGDNIGWANGWKDAMQLTDTLKVDWEQCKDSKKLYFRATTYQWSADLEYLLFNHAPQAPISEFVCLENANYPYFDNRFTLDVSALETQNEMVVEIPVYLRQVIKDPTTGAVTGEKFRANVFTRKFTIKKQ